MQPIILCGGSGSRLWPLSRSSHPKQFIALSGSNTLLQSSVARSYELTNSAPLIVSNEAHRFIIDEQLSKLKDPNIQILMEPLGKNTAPAIASAALLAIQKEDDPILLVMPADHVINQVEALKKAVAEGKRLAEKGYLVTFGVPPTSPQTGYGYIQCGATLGEKGSEDASYEVAQFHEKPDAETAEKYIKTGQHFWNSGIFMFRSSTLLSELKEHQPEILKACKQALEKAKISGNNVELDYESFDSSPSDSIDYAIMEKTKHAAMVRLTSDWNDVGVWSSVWDVNEKDTDGNVIQGDVVQKGSKNSLLVSTHRLVATVGLEDMIVIESADVVLVAPKSHSQEVKDLVNELGETHRDEVHTHRKVYRPWGAYDSIDNDIRHQVKRISVKPGQRLSVQLHYHRAEHWVVVSGTAIVTVGEEKKILSENQSVYIPAGTVHCLENPGKIDLELIEVQTGSYLGEDDIIRYDDIYGRD